MSPAETELSSSKARLHKEDSALIYTLKGSSVVNELVKSELKFKRPLYNGFSRGV